MSQLLDGFTSIHGMQIVHRDLKPSNILFKDGNCKIVNLGFGESNETCQAASSKEYKAPEFKKMIDQERINLSLDSLIKIDNYALGMILFELMCEPTTIMKEAKTDSAKYNQKEQIDTTK